MAFAMALRITLLQTLAIVIANVSHCSVIVAISLSLSLSSIAIAIAIASAIVRAAAGLGADAIAIASADVAVMHYLPKSLRIVKRRSPSFKNARSRCKTLQIQAICQKFVKNCRALHQRQSFFRRAAAHIPRQQQR